MITLQGHDLYGAVEQIIQLFFDLHSDFFAESRLENGFAYALVSYGGKTGEGRVAAEEKSDKRALSDAIKKSVFTACRQISSMPAPWGISTGIRPAKIPRQMLEDGKSDDEILAFMENEYWVSPERSRLSLQVAKNELPILKRQNERSVSLYVGIPFCPSRCAYCSFISQALTHNNKFMLPYVDACLREIERTAQIVREKGLNLACVYFGGGTPTALPPAQLRRLIKAVKESFDLSGVMEFTVEAGRPDTITPEMMQMLADCGVGRISINPQTMHQKTLDAIGRRHTPEDVERAFETARKFGIKSINADLILGLPEETPDMLCETLRRITALAPEAITVHTLYLKRAARLKTDFEKLRFAQNVNEMMQICMEKMQAYGAKPYYMYKQKNTLGNMENIGFAKIGCECLYNVYIMEEVHSVFAVGGGASTKIVKGSRIERIFNPKEAGDYVARIDEVLAKKDRISEILNEKI